MYSKKSSRVEMFRKPVSQLLALSFAGLALFAVPNHLGMMRGEVLEWLGFCLLIVAAMGRIWCALYISGRKDKVLCTDGPYSLTRNPLYLFSFIGMLGVGLALQSLALFLAGGVIYLAMYRFIILSEERRLVGLFGQDYTNYQKAVPRFFPRNFEVKRPKQYLVNPGVFERALKEVVWFLLAIVLIEGLEQVHLHGHMVYGHLPF